MNSRIRRPLYISFKSWLCCCSLPSVTIQIWVAWDQASHWGKKEKKKRRGRKKKKFGERSESVANIFPLTPFFGLSRKLYERLTGLVYKTIDSPNSNKTNNEPQLWNNRASDQQEPIKSVRGSSEVLANSFSPTEEPGPRLTFEPLHVFRVSHHAKLRRAWAKHDAGWRSP